MKKIILVLVAVFLVTSLCAISLREKNDRSVRFVKNYDKVVIFPFTNSDKHNDVFIRMRTRISNILRDYGFEVAKKHVVEYYLQKNGIDINDKLTISDIAHMGKQMGASHVLIGKIGQVRANKRFKFSALIGGGIVLYGTVGASVALIDVETQRIVFENYAKHTSKKQFLGGFQDKRYVIHEAARDLAGILFNDFTRP
ncbi:hypothetical protein KAJ27_05960 [bacterium]|nr:hypothetical protein [bacterium]